MAFKKSTKSTATIGLLLALNLLFFTLVSSCDSGCPTPASPSPPTPASSGQCPINTLQLGVCANVLNSLLSVTLGTLLPPDPRCCPLITNLVDLDAAVLCTALKAGVLGTQLNIPLCLQLLLNNCGKQLPPGYQCS